METNKQSSLPIPHHNTDNNVSPPCCSVVLVGPAHPLRGGLAVFNERLIAEFRANGHSAQIFTFSLQYPSFLFPGQTQYTNEPPPPDLPITVAVNSINPLNWWKVGRQLKKMRPDIVIFRFWLPFMGPCLGTLARIIKQNKHTCIVCISDNVLPHEKRPGDRTFTRYFLAACDAFVAMSKKVLDDLRLLEPQKPARIISHPLYDNFGNALTRQEACEYLGISPHKKYVLFFGLIRHYKGLDLLLEAMSDPRLAQKDLNLIVAGEFYEDITPYHQLIDRLGIAPRLLLKAGFVPNEWVRYYFCAADVVVLPYRNATQSGIAPMAYHFNIPMIVTNVGGLPETVKNEETGYVVEPTAEAIANGINRYFSTVGQQENFKAAMQIEKKRFSWTNLMQGILALRAEATASSKERTQNKSRFSL